MKKTIAVLLEVVVLLVVCLVVFTACRDYGYVFQYSVVGENGIISSPEPEWTENEMSFVLLMGGKKASNSYPYTLEFTATPDEGYQVKEWTFNGEVFEGNTTNIFVVTVSEHTQEIITITVEFEPIS